ncbi:MAG: bifunctional fucokinase/L-fucose-1-P-guanylyltransferase [Oscillospiraceae bacterium]|jgi:fucokinase|nr:bifunctional fucokinase/L-fucose-1-P-guanylyltransferase [Oscillospiraceae bacterium]
MIDDFTYGDAASSRAAEEVGAAFLCQSMEDCWSDWLRVCTHPNQITWSDIVITASNEAQADAVRAQIDQRAAHGSLPTQTRFHVIPDPNGMRVGSGGATLHLLRELRREEADRTLGGSRILVIHSGGDSKRAPQYSACGKLFAPVPRELPDGRVSSLFDELLIALASVPLRMPPGMLTLCGDVLLLFNALQIDLEWTRAACLTVQAPAEQGVDHGVFLGDERGVVRRFLHKQTAETLRELGAVNGRGRVCLDTGAVWLEAGLLDDLAKLVESDDAYAAFVNETVRLSFYGDFLYPMSRDATLETYLKEKPEGAQCAMLDECRRALWEIFHPVSMRMIRLSPARFIHFGTTRELRALALGSQYEYSHLGWRRHVQCVGIPDNCAAIRSRADAGAAIGKGCYFEGARILADASVGDGCVLSCVTVGECEIPPDTVIHVLPLLDGRHVARVYGVNDNPKDSWRSSMFACFPAEDIPDGAALWDAPLYAVCDTMEDAARSALSLIRLSASKADRQSAEELAIWRAAERLSLAESFMKADARRILSEQERVEDELRVDQTIAALNEHRGFDAAESCLSKKSTARARQLELLAAIARDEPYPLGTKLNRLLYRLSDAYAANSYENKCYNTINDYLYQAAIPSLPRADGLRMVRSHAEVSLPARVNFGGGWSDTPPYCVEYGGTVLNAAVLPRGKHPIRAWARRLAEPIVRLELAVTDAAEPTEQTRFCEYDNLESLRLTGDPGDPFALGKAAMLSIGLLQRAVDDRVKTSVSINIPAAQWGGGFALGVYSGLPKGSGLGGSSILAAAAIRALSQLFGLPHDDATVLERTLIAEQLMSTGGGWQDQAGALFPGIKLITSKPGVPQLLTARSIELSEPVRTALDERLSLVYTGQRRLARNILREIVGKVIDEENDALRVLSEIQRVAALMAYELERGELIKFGRLLSLHWELSKALDPGSTNRCIDLIARLCDDLIDGIMISGAGGGGFLIMLRKEGVSEARLEARLAESFQDSGVAVWSCNIDYGN